MNYLIAGSTGLVGSSILEVFRDKYDSVIGLSSSDVDLTNKEKTFDFFHKIKPDIVIDAAAKVGGIMANDKFPVDFLLNNIKIQNNLLEASHFMDVQKLIFLGSSCIYPKLSAQPIKEEYLLTGKLENTNSAYAIAKIAGIELINSYRKQYKKNWISVIPSNVYGPNDNFNLDNSHVLPALIRKIIKAKKNNIPNVVLWGSGTPLREFIFSSDLAKAIDLVIEKYNDEMPINIGTGEEVSIASLAKLIANQVGYKGEIIWDKSKPDGTPRKVLDNSKISSLGWYPETSLSEGIKKTIEWYQTSESKRM